MAKHVKDNPQGAFIADTRGRGKRSRRASVEDETKRAVELAARIEWAMERAGVSPEEVAAEARVHGDYVRNIRRGGARHPSFFTIMLISSVCEVSPYYLALMTDDPDAFAIPPRA
jgi:hypothetical protein